MADRGAGSQLWPMDYRLLSIFFALAFGCGSSGSTAGGDDGGDLGDAGVAFDATVPEGDAGIGTDAGEDPDLGGAALARYDLDAVHPEGGTFDVAADRFFVGSLGDGSVHAIDATTGEETVFFEETEPGTWWSLGMDIDETKGTLVVCAMDDRRVPDDVDPPYEGWVWELDLESGERVARHRLGDAFDTATCTDVAVLDDGTIYVVDREHPNVYRIPPDGDPELFVTDDELSASAIGLNAVVSLPDESALLAVLYLPSRMVRIALPDGAVSEVDIDGDFLNATPPLSGADGMTWSGDDLLVQFTGELARVRPITADWSTAASVTIDVPAQQTDIVHTPHGDYMLNGQAREFAFDQDTEPFALVRVDTSRFDD